MSNLTLPHMAAALARPASTSLITSRIDGAARSALLGSLARIERGRITVIENDDSWEFGRLEPHNGIQATIRVLHPAFWRRTLLGGTIGAAEAYMAGHWNCDDPTALMRIMIRNEEVMTGLNGGLARLMKPARWIWNFLRRNSKSGSRRNIGAHYDLGNDFYGLFLDPTMAYSSGIFTRPNASMEEASLEKIDLACRKLRLGPGDHLLEIGCGWGALAIHAAQNYGCRVTAATISEEQYSFARRRIEKSGLSGLITLVLEDYRDLRGEYDKLVSIEMIEAVGPQYLGEFFRRCSDLLKPQGLMLLQAITIRDQLHKRYTREVDFIKRYIFPGGHLPSVASLTATMADSSDLQLAHLEDFGPHYAETLRRWRTRLQENTARVLAMGFTEPFIRMWDFYFRYCEAGFDERRIGLKQVLIAKPGWGGEA